MKILSVIFLTTFIVFDIQAQIEWSEYNEQSNKFLETIKKQDYHDAYLMLSDDLKESNSEEEFVLYFNTITDFYGKIKSFNVESNRTQNLGVMSTLYFDIEFKETNAGLALDLISKNGKSIKVDYYENLFLEKDVFPVFNKISADALNYFKDMDYKGLYNLMEMKFLFESYQAFEDKVKKLEIDKQISYRQKAHYIRISSETVYLDVTYEVNGIGDITFEYEKEENVFELSSIRFYFTKEIEKVYNDNLLLFMDTTRLRADKENLTSEDSLFLKNKFDKYNDEQELAKLQRILDGSYESELNDDVSVAIAYDWEQLDKSDQDLIKSASEDYLSKLANNDLKGFYESCHSQFKESTPFVAFQEFGEIIAGVIEDIDKVTFVDAKMVEYTSSPKTSKFSTGGSVDKENPTYLQFYTIAGIKNQALTIHNVDNTPLSKNIIMKLGKEDGVYRLTSINFVTNSIEGKDTKYYFEIANEWSEKDSKVPQFLATSMAYRLSFLGEGTSTSLFLEITDTLLTLQKNSAMVSEIREWNVNDSIYDIINLDFIETQSDVTPNISYVSKVPLGEKTTEEEVKVLFDYFKKKYPDLVEEFGLFIFTAYDEFPVLRTKEYKNYRVIMNNR
jgi:hypothetical protein